jgi:uncharacterized protein YbgA (DUF1722 family)
MKRIEAYMRKKCESKKTELKIKMVRNALNAARYAAEEKLDTAESNLQKAMEELADATNVSSVLSRMNGYFNDRRDALDELSLADEMEKYFDEDVEIDPEDDDK